MSYKKRILIGFAGVGFSIGGILLASRANEGLFLLLCPPSIMAMALEKASVSEALIGWLIISLANALLYTLVGLLFAPMFAPSSRPAE